MDDLDNIINKLIQQTIRDNVQDRSVIENILKKGFIKQFVPDYEVYKSIVSGSENNLLEALCIDKNIIVDKKILPPQTKDHSVMLDCSVDGNIGDFPSLVTR